MPIDIALFGLQILPGTYDAWWCLVTPLKVLVGTGESERVHQLYIV